MGFYIEALNQTGDGQHGLFSVRLDKEIQWKSKSRSLFYLNIQWETLVGDRKAWDWAIHKELSLSRQKGRERERERFWEERLGLASKLGPISEVLGWTGPRCWATPSRFMAAAQPSLSGISPQKMAQPNYVRLRWIWSYFILFGRNAKTHLKVWVSCKNIVYGFGSYI